MNVSIEAVLSGVVSIAAPYGFPLESKPPKGLVRFTFGNGEAVEAMWNERDYQRAAAELEAKSA
jgi:hypothetical protein